MLDLGIRTTVKHASSSCRRIEKGDSSLLKRLSMHTSSVPGQGNEGGFEREAHGQQEKGDENLEG